MADFDLESGTYRIRITDKYPQNATLVVQVSGDEYEEFFVQDSYEFVLTSLSSLSTYMTGDGSGNSYIDWVLEVPRSAEGLDIYTQPSIVPAAVSSELDNHGEERIHIAPYVDEVVPDIICAEAFFTNFYVDKFVTIPPTWFQASDGEILMFSNMRPEDNDDVDFWAVEFTYDTLDEDFSVSTIINEERIPYGPYDGDPILIEGYVWSYDGETPTTPTCAHISTQEIGPI